MKSREDGKSEDGSDQEREFLIQIFLYISILKVRSMAEAVVFT